MQPTDIPGLVPQRRRRTGLLVVAIVVPVLLAIGLLAGAGYLVFGRHGSGGLAGFGSSVPDGWPTAGFVVKGPGATGNQVKQEVGELLVTRAGKDARYQVRRHGVLVAARSQATLDQLGTLLPLTTDVAFRPVLGTGQASPTTSPSPTTATGVAEQVPSLDGLTSYQLGPVAMTGTAVRSASAEVSQAGNSGWEVMVMLNDTGARQFAKLTASMLNQQLAIVVSGRVVSAPTIEAAIATGQVQVSGGFGRTAAEGLAAAFQLGRQPVTVTHGDPG